MIIRKGSDSEDYGMTREQFMKVKLKAYQEIDFKHSQMPHAITCQLIAVNYDTEILTLRQYPDLKEFDPDEFHVHISQCVITRPRPKAIENPLTVNKSSL